MYRHCPIIVALSGLLVLTTGIVCLWYAFPKLVESQIEKNIAIEESTQAYKLWRKQSFPLHFKTYFFNVTNADEVMMGGTPIVKEVGPYIYDLYIERQVIAVDEESDTIKYYLKKHYVFNETISGCRSDEDVVTLINMALMGTVLKVNSIMPSLLPMVSQALPYLYPGISDIFIRTKVKDLLFDGITLHCTAPEIATLCMMMKTSLPRNMKLAENGKDFVFSMFGVFNDTLLGPLNMTRGLKNTTRGDLVEYEDQSLLEVWPENGVCNMINGSDSGLFFPMNKPVETIYTFIPEICRSVGAEFDKKVVKSGLNIYRYASTKRSLSHDGPNQCFCEETDDDKFDCPVEGTINLEPCLSAPALISNPHFYLGDKKLLDYAVGLKPEQNKHESYMLIEPRTATPLEGAKRSQMNAEVKRFADFPLLQNVTDGIFPILWLEEGVTIPDEFLDILVSSFAKIALLDIFKWVLIVTGIALMFVAFTLVMYQERLMCFASKETVTLNEGGGVFTTRNSSLPFNTSVVYPVNNRPGNAGGTRNLEEENNKRNSRNWPVDQRFT